MAKVFIFMRMISYLEPLTHSGNTSDIAMSPKYIDDLAKY
jgi:hypothetical protein